MLLAPVKVHHRNKDVDIFLLKHQEQVFIILPACWGLAGQLPRIKNTPYQIYISIQLNDCDPITAPTPTDRGLPVLCGRHDGRIVNDLRWQT